MAHDGTTAELMLGMVFITCPACGEGIETDVRLKSLSTVGGSYVRVEFQPENPTHRCTGRRTPAKE